MIHCVCLIVTIVLMIAPLRWPQPNQNHPKIIVIPLKK